MLQRQAPSILSLRLPSHCDWIHEEKPPCSGLLTHSLARPCTSAATTTGTTGTDAETKLPPTTHEIDADCARVRVIVDVHVPTHLHPHPPLPPITTRRSENCCVDTQRVHELERGSATLHLRERDRVLEDTQAPEDTQTHEHALSVSSSDSESPSVMHAEKQGVGGCGAASANANAGTQTQSHGGDDGQGLGERAEGGEDIDIDDDGASDSQPPPHHA